MNRFYPLILIFPFLWIGCTSEAPFKQGPPEGWEGQANRWWQQGQDTTGLFRDLETLEAMQVVDGADVYMANASQGSDQHARQQFTKAVKRSLIRIYRNEPMVVDSIFQAHLAEKIKDVKFTSDPAEDVNKFKTQAVKLLRRNFREPRTRLELGTDIPIVYPDSLRSKKVEGAVSLQVYLNTEGDPLAIEVVEGVHPVLDQIAQEATTQMRWIPAYVLEKRDWRAIPSWARFRITFATGENN